MRTDLRTRATGLTLAAALALGAAACGGGGSAEDAAERQVRDALADAGVDGDVDLSDGGLSVETEDGSVSFGSADLPEGFPSEMPIFDPDAPTIGAVSIVDDGEQRVGVSFQLQVDEEEILDFYRRELPQNGWNMSEPDQVAVPVISVEGHGYEGGITIQPPATIGNDGTGPLTLSFMFTRPVD